MSGTRRDRYSKYIRANQRLWDSWTPVNAASGFYDIESFKQGRNTLPKLDTRALGDVAGKSLLHLQSHFGMDTLSWARLGARVTGVDFSEEGTSHARVLAEELGIEARFIQCDLYEADRHLSECFDFVVTTAGVLGWLPDIRGWGRIAAHFVRAGGTFYIREIHPLANIFDDVNTRERLDVAYSYFHQEQPLHYIERGSYAEPDAPIDNDAYYWVHSLSEILSALLDAGLILDEFAEYPYLDWPQLSFMRQRNDGFWELPPEMATIPFMFSLKMHKPPRP